MFETNVIKRLSNNISNKVRVPCSLEALRYQYHHQRIQKGGGGGGGGCSSASTACRNNSVQHSGRGIKVAWVDLAALIPPYPAVRIF
ncbi:hypothetical protein O9992_14765 [Vibrio lentus]|nr:hypothetical protein [Vibrio lentus]